MLCLPSSKYYTILTNKTKIYFSERNVMPTLVHVPRRVEQ